MAATAETLNAEAVRDRAAATYNAAADSYDKPALAFWERYGWRTVEHLALQPGHQVLDVCSGNGASALPAAEQVAPNGRVLAVDLAGALLDQAAAKARQRSLNNVDFRVGDFEALGLPDASFDVVICVFGIFFVDDMARAVRELWRMLRPHGQLAITTWGPRLFEPANTVFWQSIRAERPELYKAFNPWDRLCTPADVSALLSAGGVAQALVTAESGRQPLTAPADWWDIVLGSGYRGTIEQLDPDARARVRQTNLSYVENTHLLAVETNVIYAAARKPPLASPS